MPRDFNHDYRSISIYHITVSKRREVPYFSNLIGNSNQFVNQRLPMGKIIETNIKNFYNLSRALQVLQYVIMPDHVHFLIYVRQEIPYPVGNYISMWKAAINRQARELDAKIEAVFEKDFHDRILRKHQSLQVVINYIKLNPRRLLIRRENPDFFSRTYRLKPIRGIEFEAYGNLHLLLNPFREQVIVHRSDSPEIRSQNRERWLNTAANGGVLVSPFISPAESAIRKEIEPLGGKHILITNESFHDRYTPKGNNHDLCRQGVLLILAPKLPLPACRSTWLLLNSVAEAIASSTFAPN